MIQRMYKVEYQHYEQETGYVDKVAYVDKEADVFQYRKTITKVTPMEVEWYLPLTEEEVAEIVAAGVIDKKKQRIQQQIESKRNDLEKLQEELEKIGND